MNDGFEIVERCKDCDTVLRFRDEAGTVLRFTAHDAEFCAMSMKLRIKELAAMVESVQQSMLEMRYREAALIRALDRERNPRTPEQEQEDQVRERARLRAMGVEV